MATETEAGKSATFASAGVSWRSPLPSMLICQTEDESKGRRFPGTVRAKKTIDTVLVNRQVNVVEHLLIMCKSMDEVLSFNYGHRKADAT